MEVKIDCPMLSKQTDLKGVYRRFGIRDSGNRVTKPS